MAAEELAEPDMVRSAQRDTMDGGEMSDASQATRRAPLLLADLSSPETRDLLLTLARDVESVVAATARAALEQSQVPVSSAA